MSIKDLFNKGYSLKFLKDKSQDDFREDLESPRYVDSYSVKRQRFLPDTDFTTASNFARFGLAEEYYDTAIKRIYQTYPYDGSRAEKIEWENESTYLDLFLFENEYPRTNGYITLGSTTTYAGSRNSTFLIYSSSIPQYVLIKGGPHPDPGGDYKSDFSAGPSKKGVSKANIYHTGSQRSNNLELDLTKGVTLEFWMKKDAWAENPGDGQPREYIFHLWNSGSAVSPYPSYGSMYVNIDSASDKGTVYTYTVSGSTSIYLPHKTGLSNVADGNWHHYSITAKTHGENTVSRLYVDGTNTSEYVNTNTITTAITGTTIASIGSLVGPLPGDHGNIGWGNIASASFDEFRYWKTERDAQQIGRFYKDQVGGGTNTDNIKYDDVSNKVDLGVYYKFNEGIVGVSSTDEAVLDYSGRISNGTLTNYATGCRSTGSAIILSNAATKEFKDPILYSTHSDVSALVTSKKDLGRAHDHNNPVSLYKSLPGWILDEDGKESNHLKYLMQILASYFDDLYLQIEKLSKLKDINYPDDNKYEKPLPFADRLLETRGYDAPELFAHASALAKYMERSERKLFEKKLYEVKNIIYQNIYNNLSYIQKSKGTYKSLRNFLRCFGVDEELIKLNIYANNDVYEFKDNFTNTALRKKFIDFDDAETRFNASSSYLNSFSSTAYQFKNPIQDQATATFVGTAALNGADGTNLILTNADGSTVTFHTDPTKNFGDTSSDGGDHTWIINTRDISGGSEIRKATQAFHIACLTAIAAGELDMTAVPATNTGTQTSFTLTQTTAGTAGNTAITLITGMTADGATAFANGKDHNATSYIAGIATSSITGAAFTVEAEVILPKRFLGSDPNYGLFPSLTSSIFGLHAVTPSDTDFTFATDDAINFNVVIGKNPGDRRNGSFSLITSGSSNIITDVSSDEYTGIYDNQKWNLAFRLRPTNYPISNLVSGAIAGSGSYTYELYGGQFISGDLQDEFVVTGTMHLTGAAKFFTEPKRLFVGAARKNFTGSSVEQHSDVKVSSVRAWYSYLDNAAMRAHGRDSNTCGALHPLENASLIDQVDFLGTKVPQIKTLVLNWNMDNITGSDANGQFNIDDFSSGSADTSSYGILTPIIEKNYPGRGDFFESTPDYQDQAVDVEFVQTARQKLPEVVSSDDMVKVLNKQDDVVFTRDTTYVQHMLSIEKSAYQIVSEEMLRFFASVVDFNNLVGEPVNRYRPYYKKLEKLRQLFFERIEANVDLEKFIEYYKWIDDAVTMMIAQLIPASANTPELLRNMVESHILERNKYWTKFPTLETAPHNPISSLKGIEELKYNWKFGHAPVGAEENTNQNISCLWWKQRADRTDVLSSGDTSVDSNKDAILHALVTEVTGTGPKLLSDTSTKYAGSYYFNRSLARPVELEGNRSLNFKGGGNSRNSTAHDYYKSVIKWGSDDDFIYLDVDNEIKDTVCDDQVTPPELEKKKFKIQALTMPAEETTDSNAQGTGKNDLKYTDAKSTLLLPFSIYSSSIGATGYQALYSSQIGINFTNLHEDKYGFDAEIPMQGPFAEKYVGGMQHRHVGLNQGSDTWSTRPEGWHIQEFLDDSGADETIFVENLDNATTTPTNDVKAILSIPYGSMTGDPSGYEYWRNGTNADNGWTFLKDRATQTAGTGPANGPSGAGYAYTEVLPSKVGQTFSLVTPLIDLLDMSSSSVIRMYFYYHMHGMHIGNLKVQASQDPNFESGVEDLLVAWANQAGTILFNSTFISGQQHGSPQAPWYIAYLSSDSAWGNGLSTWLGKRFYIRFLYTAGITHLSDCAIGSFKLYKYRNSSFQNSFKLLSPTHGDHNRPRAIYTRDIIAKRPVNIRNIEMTASSPTKAGNYLDRYEYVSTVSPEVNDPYFVKNVDQITQTNLRYLASSHETYVVFVGNQPAPGGASIESLLTGTVGRVRTNLSYADYALPDRSFISGTTIRNRTRIKTRFSSPGGFETLSRGYLDPAHETYSPNNAMTYRNPWPRKVYNSHLQAHMGKFGTSAHVGSARLYGSHGYEIPGSIVGANYTLVGDASRHKYHRNNTDRLEFGEGDPVVDDQGAGALVVTASTYDNAFVSHMIPRSDYQASWITASLI